MDNQKFAKRLRELRKEKHLNRQQLAEEVGFSESAIGMYETGQRRPSYEKMEELADYFNVDLNYLMGDSDTKDSFIEKLCNDFNITYDEIVMIIALRNHPELLKQINNFSLVSATIEVQHQIISKMKYD